jgi:GNAT superfamily N-acetyltransferase
MRVEEKERIGELRLQKVVPFTSTYKDGLRVGEAFHRSNQNLEALTIRYEPRYRFVMDLEQCRKTILDPQERIKEYIRHAKGYSKVIHYRAREFHLEMLNPRAECYLLSRDDDEIVGYFSLVYPHGILEPPRQCIFKKLWNLVMINWYKWKYRVINWFADPSRRTFVEAVKQSAADYKQLVPDEKTLANMSYEELEKANYPLNKYVWIHQVFLTPEYQGQGIAKKLMVYALENATDATTEFTYNTSRAVGPLKFNLFATEEGKGLYARMGFQEQISANITDGDKCYKLTRMDRKVRIE